MADSRDSGSALLQRTQEMRARAESAIVSNERYGNEIWFDHRGATVLFADLARDVVALTKELERGAGVSGSPDETHREALANTLTQILAWPVPVQGGGTATVATYTLPKWLADQANAALAGVGEHRPDQPQEKTLDSAASGALKELVDAAGPVVTEFSTASREERWPAVKRSDLARLEQALSKASRSAVREQEA